MKKGDLVRLKPRSAWTKQAAEIHGYLWLVVRGGTKTVDCTSIATGFHSWFYTTYLEQANEER